MDSTPPLNGTNVAIKFLTAFGIANAPFFQKVQPDVDIRGSYRLDQAHDSLMPRNGISAGSEYAPWTSVWQYSGFQTVGP